MGGLVRRFEDKQTCWTPHRRGWWRRICSSRWVERTRINNSLHLHGFGPVSCCAEHITSEKLLVWRESQLDEDLWCYNETVESINVCQSYFHLLAKVLLFPFSHEFHRHLLLFLLISLKNTTLKNQSHAHRTGLVIKTFPPFFRCASLKRSFK